MNDANEVRRSGPDVKPEVGMVVDCARDIDGTAFTTPRVPIRIDRVDGLSFHGTYLHCASDTGDTSSAWESGCYDILTSLAPGYCATGPIADAPAKCRGEPCGEPSGDVSCVVYWPGQTCECKWVDGVHRYFCSPECRDRAAKPTCLGRPCGSRVVPGHSVFPPDVKWPAVHVYDGRCWCSPACMKRAGLKSSDVAEVEAWVAKQATKPAPTKAPAPWKCNNKKCKTPRAPKYTGPAESMFMFSYCLVCADEMVCDVRAKTDATRAPFSPESAYAAWAHESPPFEPGQAAILATAGAGARGREHHGLFLLDPIDEI